MENNIVNISNGAYITCTNSTFSLVFNDQLIIANCTNYAYVYHELIVVQKDDTIHVYAYRPVVINNVKQLKKLAEAKLYSPNVWIKVAVSGRFYYIDNHCHVSTTERLREG